MTEKNYTSETSFTQQFKYYLCVRACVLARVLPPRPL